MIQFLAFNLLGFGCALITRLAPEPQNVTQPLFYVPCFFIFSLFLFSLLSWGKIITHQFRILDPLNDLKPWEGVLFYLAFGVCFFYGAFYGLMGIGLFKSEYFYILWFFLAAGTWGARIPKLPLTRWSIPILIIVIIRMLEAFQINSHGDAYITYLAAPREWATTGRFISGLTFTEFFLATSWESLFAWGTALMGLTAGQGMDLTQIFSQLITAAIGTFGIGLAAMAIADRLLPINLSKRLVWIQWIIPITAAQIPSLRWTANLAKNDYGICFLGLTVFALLIRGEDSPFRFRNWFAIGLVLGVALVGKLTLAPLAIAIGLVYLVPHPAKSIALALGAVTAATPIWIRNFSLTTNPFFPWLGGVFPTDLAGISASEGGARATAGLFDFGFFVQNWTSYLQEFLNESWVFLFFPFAGFFFSSNKKLRKFWTIAIIALLLFTLLIRPQTEIRYQSAVLMFSVIIGLVVFALLLETAPSKKLKETSAYGLALITLVTSNIPFFSIAQVGGKKFGLWPNRYPEYLELGGPAKLWIRKHLPTNASILVVGDGYVYYLVDRKIFPYGRDKNLEQPIADNQIEIAASRFFNATHDYLYLNSTADYVLYRQRIDQVIQWATHHPEVWNPACLSWQDSVAQVWDLHCLRSK